MTDKPVQYNTTVEDEHWRQEEFQWARILAAGHPAKGMVLIYLQKACTAFHEFEPAFRAGALDDSRSDFFRRRLANRLRQLLTTMKNNRLDDLEGTVELAAILQAVERATATTELADLTERLHLAGHALVDALERSSSSSANG